MQHLQGKTGTFHCLTPVLCKHFELWNPRRRIWIAGYDTRDFYSCFDRPSVGTVLVPSNPLFVRGGGGGEKES